MEQGSTSGNRDETLDPRAALAEVEAAERRAQQEVAVPTAPILAMWGVAWLIAFTVTFLAGEAERPLAFLGPVGVNVVWAVCIGGAVIGQVAVIARKTRGVVPDPRRQRIYQMTTITWLLAMILAGAMVAAAGSPSGGPAMFFVFTVALLYMAFGAVDDDGALFGLGAWFGALNVAAAILAPAWYALAMALLGGGAFLVVAAALRGRESRDSAASAG